MHQGGSGHRNTENVSVSLGYSCQLLVGFISHFSEQQFHSDCVCVFVYALPHLSLHKLTALRKLLWWLQQSPTYYQLYCFQCWLSGCWKASPLATSGSVHKTPFCWQKHCKEGRRDVARWYGEVKMSPWLLASWLSCLKRVLECSHQLTAQLSSFVQNSILGVCISESCCVCL